MASGEVPMQVRRAPEHRRIRGKTAHSRRIDYQHQHTLHNAGCCPEGAQQAAVVLRTTSNRRPDATGARAKDWWKPPSMRLVVASAPALAYNNK